MDASLPFASKRRFLAVWNLTEHRGRTKSCAAAQGKHGKLYCITFDKMLQQEANFLTQNA